MPSGVSLQSIREYRLPRTKLTVEDALRLLVKIRLYAAGAELVTNSAESAEAPQRLVPHAVCALARRWRSWAWRAVGPGLW